MFISNIIQLREFDLSKANDFVQYWSKQYSYPSVGDCNTNETIDYIKELNLGNRLSEQNIKRLLRWKIFLFHISRPFEFPIADRNVFQSFSIHRQIEIPTDWEGCQNYVDYFFQIVIAANIINEKPKSNEPNLNEIIKELKEVDNALFTFGQFLNSYWKTSLI